MVFKKSGLAFAQSSSSWKISTQVAFCSSVNTHVTNFDATRRMPNLSLKMEWHDPALTLASSASSLTVNRRFSRTKSRTVLMWTSSVDVDGRAFRGSSSVEVLPGLNRLYHSKHCDRLIASSPKASRSKLNVVALFPSLKQNLTHTRWSCKCFISHADTKCTTDSCRPWHVLLVRANGLTLSSAPCCTIVLKDAARWCNFVHLIPSSSSRVVHSIRSFCEHTLYMHYST